MRSLVWALLAFSLWLIAHVIIWRIRRPAGQYAALVALCVGVLIVSLGTVAAIRLADADLGTWVPATRLDDLNVVVLCAALALAYLVTYSAIQADSPTMTILLRVAQAGPSGLSPEEMLAELNDEALVVPRLEDLVAGNLVRQDGRRYVISARGTLLAAIYVRYRGLLGMEKGG